MNERRNARHNTRARVRALQVVTVDIQTPAKRVRCEWQIAKWRGGAAWHCGIGGVA